MINVGGKNVNRKANEISQIIQINFANFGGVGDGSFNNAQAIIDMVAAVNVRDGNCTVLIPPGTYNYTPSLTTSGAWRAASEFLDVQDVTILGYGAVFKQVKDPAWTTLAASGLGNQEGPLNFRSSGDKTCKKIRIYGLKLQGDRVPYDATSDGSIMGIALRGIDDVIIRDCEINGWGTDGIYVGTTYGNTYKSNNITIDTCTLNNNTRQGISVAGGDNIRIINPTIKNTTGGSFGHAIDFEANTPQINYGVVVQGGYFENNQRGAFNFIATQNARIVGCIINELTANGSIYVDGNSSDIDISNCSITSLRAAIYINGGDISNFKLHHCYCKTIDQPNNNATVRINTSNTKTGLNDIKIQDNTFIGAGGVVIKADGKIYFERNKMTVSKQNAASADCFDFMIEADCSMVGNEIEIQSDVVFAEKFVYATKGLVRDNKFTSHAAAKCNIRDNRGSAFVDASLVIGRNVFSTNFYYKGEHTSLDLTTEATVISFYGGRFGGSQYRQVHGGYSRITNGTAPQRGDVTFSGSEFYGWYCNSSLVWQLTQQTIGKGSTGARPSSLVAQHQGLQYLDTTLSANGKLITWNGSAWVDATGATV